MTTQEKAQQLAIELVNHWQGKRARGIADKFEIGEAVVSVDFKDHSDSYRQWFFYINNVQVEKFQLVQALTMLPTLTVMMESVV